MSFSFKEEKNKNTVGRSGAEWKSSTEMCNVFDIDLQLQLKLLFISMEYFLG